jgi:hypothetical protein
VYNLCLQETSTSVIPVAPGSADTENQMAALVQEWRNEQKGLPRKIVYTLSHKYSEKNLLLENLKTSDKAVAYLLKKLFSDSLTVILGTIYKESHCDEECDDEPFEDTYKIKNLKQLTDGGIELAKFKRSELSVDFEAEVIPESCFQNIKPYNK